MDFAGIAALLSLPAALSLAFWPVIRDHSAMTRLDRITAIIERAKGDGPSSKLLSEARDALMVRVALNSLAPKYLGALILGWVFVVLGASMALLLLLMVVVAPDGVASLPEETQSGMADSTITTAVLNLFGITLLAARSVYRERYLKQARDRHGVHEVDDRSPVM